MDRKVLSLLGLAAKARGVTSGEMMTEKAVRSGRAFLVLVSAEASENTRKKFSDLCGFYAVPFRICGTMRELGNCIGKEFRASVAVMNEGLAGSILKKLEEDLSGEEPEYREEFRDREESEYREEPE